MYAKKILLSAPLLFCLQIAGAAEEPQPQPTLPVEEVRELARSLDAIKQLYVEDVTDQELINAAIRGMVESLDPHSSLFIQEELDEFKDSNAGQFGGLGIEVGMFEGWVRVISPIDDTPAAKAGMQPGDLILTLDGTSVQGMSISEAVEIMRGEPGTDIELLVRREGEDKPLEITITRAIINVTSVRSRLLAPGFAYLRVASFQERSGTDVKKQLAKMMEEGPIKGIVLDLRNNPGGLISAAIDITDTFIGEKLVVSTVGRAETTNQEYLATQDILAEDIPVVVLINGGSASASEIVAGALQDYGRAVIMGTKSFGKGSVQQLMPIGENKAIKITISRYFTPLGRSIQAKGIEPDIWVDRATLTKQESRQYISEADLQGRLDNPTQEGEQSESKDGEEVEPNDDLSQTDYQLYEALTLLKGMAILSGNR